MAKLLKLRRGTTSQHSSFTGAEGEVTVDTTKDTLVVHDGSTAGGTPLAKESAVTAIPAVIDEDNMSSDSATRPPSQQSVKAYVDAADNGKASLSGASFTGTVTIPTPSSNDNSTKAASTAYVQTELGDYAPLNNPALTGTVTAVNLTTSADVTFTGSSANVVFDASDNALEFADNAKATFGDSGDLELSHSGTHSYIKDAGTGALKICSNALSFRNAADNEDVAYFLENGRTELYYDNSAKFETTTTGCTVTGTLVATTFSGSGASLTSLPAGNLTGSLPAISGANLTNLSAGNLTGSLPAISGANLTGLAGGGFASMQVFTSSGTWTRPSGVKIIKVTVVGGGGSGGIANGLYSDGGDGGGGAGCAIEVIDVSTGPSSVSVTVGSGASGNGGYNNGGSTGGTSSFGSYCQATGGEGGWYQETQNTAGAAPGSGSGGNINLTGGNGIKGCGNGGNQNSAWNGPGGQGAGPYSITRGAGINSTTSTQANTNAYGSGGGGASAGTSGSGGHGIVVVEEFK